MGFVPKKKKRRARGKRNDCVLKKVDVKSISSVAMETVRNRNVYIEVD